MNQSVRIVLIVSFIFAIHFFLDTLTFSYIRDSIYNKINQFGLSHFFAYIIVGIPLLVGTYFINDKNVKNGLGLDSNILHGLIFSIICVAPSFLVFIFLGEFNKEFSFNSFLIKVVSAAFFEEVYFRGFLFGLIFRKTSLGFISSSLIGALLFGFIHMYQSSEIIELAGIFAITFIGALLFGWAYTEWNFNIWIPIFLHLFMNLLWEIFDISDNALGGINSNILRLLIIALIISCTIYWKKKKSIPLTITRKNFL